MELIFRQKKRLPLGEEAPSYFDGKLYIPSWGALEQKEIDYILEAEKEKERNRKRVYSTNRELLDQLVMIALEAPAGKRKQVITEMLRKQGREI